MIRFHWKHLAIALTVLPVAAILFAWIGFFNIGASSGHWKITDWFLHFAMRSAVRTYSLAVETPEILPAEGIQPAAGHFARGCAGCHGAPGEPRSPAVLKMLPQPPDLTTVVPEWNDAELFRIVKHGVRFTGMPAWPTQERDDEVWAMVAFLRTLPSLEPAAYRALAYGKAGTMTAAPHDFDEIVAECARCHGEAGIGESSLVPILAGQSEAYVLESLRAYAEGRRASGIMALPAAAIPSSEMQAIARHFAQMTPATASAPQPPSDMLTRGAQIARSGIPAEGVPSCLSCHGATPANPIYPKIAGQHADVLKTQLLLFRAGTRGGTAYNHLMVRAVKGLSDDDIEAVASYFSAQP